MAEINDWKEVPIDDWQEVPIGDTNEAKKPTDINRLAQIGAGGANKTIANTLGLPVDIVNSVLSLAGLGIEEPVGGSKFFSKMMPETPQPQTTGETFIQALGEQAPLAPFTGPAIPIASG